MDKDNRGTPTTGPPPSGEQWRERAPGESEVRYTVETRFTVPEPRAVVVFKAETEGRGKTDRIEGGGS